VKYEFKTDEELKLFISNNLITTMEAAEILNCSRQNIDGMVKHWHPLGAFLLERTYLTAR
jgi:hypothetical protein